MAEQLTAKFLASMVASTLLWVGPIPLKAPRPITALALMGSVAGYGYAYAISSGLEKQWRTGRRFALKEDRLEQFQFAVSELAEKAELQALINPLGRSNSANSELSSESAGIRSGSQGNANSELSSELSSANSELSSASSELSSEPLNWTQFDLKKAEAAAMIRQAISDGMGKNQIIEAFWGIKPGGSKAYKAAAAEYEILAKSN